MGDSVRYPRPREWTPQGTLRQASTARRHKMKTTLPTTAVILLLSAGIAAPTMTIDGAGGTMHSPGYSLWFSEYAKFHPALHIHYRAIGSSNGIQQLTTGSVFFGASDGP